MSEKLQKVLAHAGRGSRREIEQWISEGRIQVNGRSAKLGDRVELTDRILVDGQAVFIRSQQHSQIKALIYHKPEGEIVSRSDPAGRPTVFEKLPEIAESRWVSVGRLDINTSGLLLFTNSGELANKLMHPSSGVEREYLARVRGRLSPEVVAQLTRVGIDLDGHNAKFESVTAANMGEEGSNHWYRVVIKEGRYREVRRMFEAVNHLVSRLKRIRYGSVKLTRDIKLGQAVKMAPQALEKLIATAQLESEFADRSTVNKMRASRATRTAKADANPEGRSTGKHSQDRESGSRKTGVRTGSRSAKQGEVKSARSNKVRSVRDTATEPPKRGAPANRSSQSSAKPHSGSKVTTAGTARTARTSDAAKPRAKPKSRTAKSPRRIRGD